MILSQKNGIFIWQGDIYLTVRDLYLTGRDIHLTGRDIYFEKGYNFVTNYLGDEILITCTNPNPQIMIVNLQKLETLKFGNFWSGE